MDIWQAMKHYEDICERYVGWVYFEAWLERLPIDVNDMAYCTAIKFIADRLRSFDTLQRTPKNTDKDVQLLFDLGFANLTYNPNFTKG